MKNVFKGMTFMIVAGVIIRLVSNDLGVIVFGGIILGAFASMVAKAISLSREIKKAGIKMKYHYMPDEEITVGELMTLPVGEGLKYQGHHE